jgi:hypothetical protein
LKAVPCPGPAGSFHRVGTDVGVAGTRVLIDKDRGYARESVALQVRGESQFGEWVGYAVRVVGVDMPYPARKPEGYIQQQTRTKRMSVINGKQVGIGPTGTALTGIGEVLVTVKAHAVTVLIGELRAHQVLFAEAIVNLDIELVVVIAP